MIDENKLKTAYEIVRDFKRFNPLTKTFHTFALADYRVPTAKGIHKYERNKGIDMVKPNTLKYISKYLHNADEDMIFEAIIILLYHLKVKQNDFKKMKKMYELISDYYLHINENKVTPTIDITNAAVVYSISFNIANVTINKIGLATDIKRWQKMMSDIRSKYPFVSVGSFAINQVIQFDTLEQAKAFEEEALKNLKQHSDYSKCKYCFEGYTESYINKIKQ